MLEIKNYGPYIGEADYHERLNSEVRPYLKARREDGDMISYDGGNLHYVYVKADEEKAAVTVFHGKGEFFEKLEELVYVMVKNGFSVFMLEQRGFGRSMRLTEDKDKIHVDSFDDYVRDQWDFFWQVVMKKAKSDVKLMFAHSMGGMVGARFLEVHPQCYRAAILSSPMIGLHVKQPEFVVSALTGLAHLFKNDEKFAPGQHGYQPYQWNQKVMKSKARFDEMFTLREENEEFQTTGVSYGWIRESRFMTNDILNNAEKACVPILLCQAMQDETVSNEMQHVFASFAPNVMMVQFPEAGHEIYAAGDDERGMFFDWIISFYNEVLEGLRRE